MPERVTLAIPTFRRPGPLKQLLLQVAHSPKLRESFNVLVIDDSGDPKSRSEYHSAVLSDATLTGALDLEYFENAENQGFARTFTDIFERVTTRHVLFMADDDLLVEDHIADILLFLDRVDPDLLSPQWLSRSGRFGRGVRATRKVTLEEHRLCCGHVPGLIYNVERATKHIDFVRQRIARGCAATLTYPSVALTIPLILANDNCWYFNAPVAREGSACGSNLTDRTGNSYASTASRIQQIAALDDLILSLPPSARRDRILREARGWSIAKAIGSDAHLRQYARDRFGPRWTIKRVAQRAAAFSRRIWTGRRKEPGGST